MSIARRTFLASMLPMLGVTFAEGAEPLPIIDTHTHFYDPTRAEGVPWPGKDNKVLYRKVMPADYRALKQPLPVTGTVVVEASPWVEDNQWLLDLAEKDPFLVGIVGNLKPGSDMFVQQLRRFAKNPLYRGFRINNDVLRDVPLATLKRDLHALVDLDLCLDINGGPALLGDMLPVAKAVPKLRIVVNHMANVRIDGKAPPKEWARDIQRVAECENVSIKLSALVESTGRKPSEVPTDIAFYAPTLDVIWKAFGPSRCMYGSDWPVSERFASCGAVLQLLLDYVTDPAARQEVFAKSAQRAYRFVMPK